MMWNLWISVDKTGHAESLQIMLARSLVLLAPLSKIESLYVGAAIAVQIVHLHLATGDCPEPFWSPNYFMSEES